MKQSSNGKILESQWRERTHSQIPGELGLFCLESSVEYLFNFDDMCVRGGVWTGVGHFEGQECQIPLRTGATGGC